MTAPARPHPVRRLVNASKQLIAPRESCEDPRRSRAQHTTAARIGAHLISFLTRFVAVRIAIELLGAERYGAWLASTACISWLGLADLGMGPAIINTISVAAAEDDQDRMRAHVSTAFFTQLAIAMILLVVLGIVVGTGSAPELVGIRSESLKGDTTLFVCVAGLAFCASFAFSFVAPLCLAFQKGHIPPLVACCNAVALMISFAYLLAHDGSVVAFALVSAFIPVLGNLVLFCYVFYGPYRSIRPELASWSLASTRRFVAVGLPMFVTQVGEVALFQTSSILIAHIIGAGSVAKYSVAVALFAAVAQVCHAIYHPYWPAMTEAYAKRDVAWIRKTLLRLVKVNAGIMTTGAVLIVLNGRWLIQFWAGESLVPSTEMLCSIGLYYVVLSPAAIFGSAMLAFGSVKLQSVLTLLAGVTQIIGFCLAAPWAGLLALPVSGALGLAFQAGLSGVKVRSTLRRCTSIDSCRISGAF